MKILIVKLGALGDVLRTTPLLTAFRKTHPGCEITWVVDAAHADVLADNPLISRLWTYSPETLDALDRENFDLAVNLDKEPEALEAISRARAAQKKGFGRSPKGGVIPLDFLSDYAVRLGLDDELKFRINQKTYQQICFEQVGLRFHGEEYVFEPGEKALAAAQNFSAFTRPVIGINTGAGKRFAGKRLPVDALVRLADLCTGEIAATVFLLGGEDELERNREIQRRAARPVVNTGSHPIRTFAAILRRCDAVVSGDTTAMHMAIAMKVPVVAYFASTCAPEIELYGRGRKVVSAISCAPCYKKICPIDEQCMKDLQPQELFEAVREILSENQVRR